MNGITPPSSLLALGLAASLSLAACGEDSDPTDSDPREGTPSTSSFEVEFSNGGTSQTYSGSINSDETSEESWGASIAGGVITILMQDGSGVAINAVIDTAQNTYATGDFALSEPPEGTFVTLLDPLGGDTFNTLDEGTVKLTSCPKAIGDKVVGSFNNVVLYSEMDESSRTLSGNFDVPVYAMSGSLNCPPADEPDNDDEQPDDNDDQPNACQGYEYCESGDGVCCPYAECMATCSFNCVMEDEECAGGLNPAACDSCTLDYLDSCGVDQACRDAAAALTTCEEDAGCSELEDEDAATSCTESNCCSELQAAY
ncbi:hypothetical protein FRC98_19040 [Lujinxingia vulgaris]|uniref:Uncharacterized protein n=1 Tax=Lujinxingia vulgaris TaxID=2600176 RepID=A0A5C6X6F0_9DELT|nr:hypothetical protein [Lujinxingia vulgaris]TXD34288.1 hypothetical protein FRC98_19040 [Lujinxingia vulgaris]